MTAKIASREKPWTGKRFGPCKVKKHPSKEVNKKK